MKKLFLKLSKSRLNKFSKVQLKTRPRAMQVYLAVLLWLDRHGGYSLGVEYIGSRASGMLCWHKDLKIFISRWTGLKHRQVQRYLRSFEATGLIYIDDNQLWIDGKVRRQYFLKKRYDLRARPGEQYLTFNMRGRGQRGFDIYGCLESCIRADSHPLHPDQLKFNVSRQTRSYRAKSKTYKKKKKRRFKVKIQLCLPTACKNMTPKKIQNPAPFFRMDRRTTKSAKKNPAYFTKTYQKQLCLIHKNQRIWVDWWKTKLADSEFIKIQSGLSLSDRALWYKGRLYRQKYPKTDPYVYEFMPKPVRRSWKSVPDYGPSIPSAIDTRKQIAESLGLSVPAYLSKIRAESSQYSGNNRA